MTINYWSCFSGDFGEQGDIYQDIEGKSYNYDDTVPNHLGIMVGDVLIIRDDKALTGFGWVEEVRTFNKTKHMTLCPTCKRSGPSTRTTRTPRYRCQNGHEFEQPVFEDRPMTAYEARYEQTWSTFDGLPSRDLLNQLYSGADQQNAIRRLKTAPANSFLRAQSALFGYLELADSSAQSDAKPEDPTAGLVPVTAKRRVGQAEFRARLIERFGENCSVTGPQPREILDAAHLYLFAEHTKHAISGGLLFRSDIHRLFDSFNLVVNPDTWLVELSPSVKKYTSLAPLHGQPLLVHPGLRPQANWLQAHMKVAHARWGLA